MDVAEYVKMEDRVAQLLGDAKDELQCLLTWKFLCLHFPHWTRNINEIDRMIIHERRKREEKH